MFPAFGVSERETPQPPRPGLVQGCRHCRIWCRGAGHCGIAGGTAGWHCRHCRLHCRALQAQERHCSWGELQGTRSEGIFFADRRNHSPRLCGEGSELPLSVRKISVWGGPADRHIECVTNTGGCGHQGHCGPHGNGCHCMDVGAGRGKGRPAHHSAGVTFTLLASRLRCGHRRGSTGSLKKI